MLIAKNSRINIVYLGFRGGGVKITEMIVLDLLKSSSEFEVSVHLRQGTAETYTQEIVGKIKLKEWGISRKFEDVVSYFISLFRVLFLPNSLGFTRDSINIVTLTSPYSLPLELILKIRRRKLILVVHDSVKHVGDNWPPNSVILFRNILSDIIITLSVSVKENVMSRFPKKTVLLYPHPVFKFGATSYPPELFRNSDYILFLGRIRAYKGVDNLLAAVSANPSLQRIPIVIAGEGRITRNLPSNVLLINRWLSDSEISGLIERARLVVFPYIEASQSGLVGTVINRQKRILVSSCDGLKEQVENYVNAWVCTDLSPSRLGISIVSAYDAELETKSAITAEQVSFLDTFKEILKRI